MKQAAAMSESEQERLLSANADGRLALVADSFARLTGRPLLADGPATPRRLWIAPFVLLAHDAAPDPVFFYGNRRALDLFEMTADQLLRTPSRLSAEPDEREARARLLDEVGRQGFIANYAGVRVSATGRRFRIEQATVWNLIDAEGRRHGQAAAFSDWTRLD